MLSQKMRLEFVFVAACLIIGSTCGCTNNSPESLLSKANSTNIQKLTNLYNQYQADHNFVGPDSVESLRTYIENDIPSFIKERIELASTDEVFVSERDGQPFKIRWEIIGSSRGCTEPAIFETAGRDGKYLIGFLNMTTREVDKDEYDRLWADSDAS